MNRHGSLDPDTLLELARRAAVPSSRNVGTARECLDVKDLTSGKSRLGMIAGVSFTEVTGRLRLVAEGLGSMV